MSTARLLVIDDNPGDLILIETALELLGDPVSVATHTDAGEALRELSDCAPDDLPRAILLDLNMPGLHGHEFLERVQGDERLRALSVVVMSSSKIPSDVQRSLSLGARAHVTKQVGITAICDVIRGLRHHWANDTEAKAGPSEA